MPLLLDDLAELAGCDYLSDLRCPDIHGDLKRTLLRLPAENYPAAEWAEALSYLTGLGDARGTAEELRRMLLERLDT